MVNLYWLITAFVNVLTYELQDFYFSSSFLQKYLLIFLL